jgi:hypothetical protein
MSWGGNAWGGDASEDEEEKEEREMTNKKDYVVSLVDCRPNMFLKNEEGETHFQAVMRVLNKLMKQKVMDGDADQQAIIFFGTRKHKNMSDFENLCIFQELEMPTAQRIKEIEVRDSIGRSIRAAFKLSPSRQYLIRTLTLRTSMARWQ